MTVSTTPARPSLTISKPTVLTGPRTLAGVDVYLGSDLSFDSAPDIAGSPSSTPVTLQFDRYAHLIQTSAKVSIVDTSGSLGPGAAEFGVAPAINALVLDGQLDAGTKNGTFLISAGTITANGQITVSNGDHLILGDAGLGTGAVTIGASGKISISGAGTLVQMGVSAHLDQGQVIDYLYQPLTIAGTVTVHTGATLALQGSFNITSFGHVYNLGGTVLISGQLDLQGGTLGTTRALGKVTLGGLGEIDNGTIDNRSGFLTVAGTLNNVKYRGAAIDAHNHTVLIEGGSQIFAKDGIGLGTINGAPILVGTQTLDRLHIELDGNLGVQTVQETYFINNGGGGFGPTDVTLTLGASVRIDHIGKISSITGASSAAFDQSSAGNIAFSYALVNDGQIVAALTGGTLTISNFDNFENKGTITISRGDTIDVEAPYQQQGGFSAPAFTNDAGGKIVIRSASHLVLAASSDVSLVNSGLIELDSGNLDLSAPSSFNTSALNAAGGLIVGYGTILANALGQTTNAGVIEARGGRLNIDGAVAGKGTLSIDANAQLVLTDSLGSGSVTNDVQFHGDHATLLLDAPGHLSGAVTHWQATDRIDFAALLVTSVQAGDHFLNIYDKSGLQYHLLTDIAPKAGASFAVTSDGHGGSLVTLLSLSPATSHAGSSAIS